MNDLKRHAIVLTLLVWLTALLWPSYSRRPALDVWMLDVGQGESMLLREPGGQLLLYDGGPNDLVLSRLGNLLPPWQRHIDLVILSHTHVDHIRGLIDVLDRYRVGQVWVSGAFQRDGDYYAFTDAVAKSKTPVKTVWFNQKTCGLTPETCPAASRFGKATIQIYHPLEDMQGMSPHDAHDATVSAMVRLNEQSVFLTGDLNEGHERDMLSACKPPFCSLQAGILQVPHHGSTSGLLPAFLAAVKPNEAWISVGQPNPYHHPRQEIIDRLKQADVPTYRTDRDGTIHRVLASARGSP